MNEKELLELAIKDLVRISILANNIIIKGSFAGCDADEVKEVLDICNHVVSTFSSSELRSKECEDDESQEESDN